MKLWIDDVRPAPKGYVWLRSVRHAQKYIRGCEGMCAEGEKYRAKYEIELIDIDHDAGDYAHDGGDYIKLLDWLEETGRSYPIHIHSQNVVGATNMRAIIKRNGWKEI